LRDPETRISDSTVRRLSGYYRVLGEMMEEGAETASSEEIARRGGITSAQVRKDLSFFGHFGKRGTGYAVEPLHDEIKSILGLNRRWKVALIGAGNLAHALSAYREFRRQGFEIVALFDSDPEKIGTKWDDVEVYPMSKLEEMAKEGAFEIGVITTPAASAQDVADQLVNAGISGILNFAPRKITVPEGVNLRNVNMAIEFESLSFALK